MAPGDSGQQPSNTMLIRHEAIFIPPGSTTSKLQNPLQVPWKFTLLNETRLRGNATATQGGAAYVLSMVSTLRACQFQGIWDGKTQTPCLACMLHTVPWGSRLDKHGFRSRHAPAPGGLNCRQWKTKFRTCARGWPTCIPDCCTCSKHGLSLAGMSVPGGLGQQILKTMLGRYEALGGLWRYRFQRGPQVC